MQIRTKTILSMLAVILVLSGGYLYIFIHQQQENRQLIINGNKIRARTLITTVADRLNQQYRGRIQGLIYSRRDIVQLFADRERHRLFKAILPVFKQLRREDEYFSHINFVLPDNSLFLQIDKPGQHEEGCACFPKVTNGAGGPRMSSGFEDDCYGLDFFIVQPVFEQKKYIGSMSFGIRVDEFLDALRDKLDLPVALLLTGARLDKDALKDHAAFPVDGGMIYAYNDSFFSGNAQRLHIRNENQTMDTANGGVYDIFTSYVIKNIQGKEIGRIILALDVTNFVESQHRDLFRLIVITMALLVVATLILYFNFNKILGRIGELNDRLRGKNEELRKAGEQLEALVEKRTAELEETNRHLKEEVRRRQEANRALHCSVHEWQSTFDAISDPVTILDQDMVIVVANKAAHELLSPDGEEVVGRNCYALFAAGSKPCRNCPAAAASYDGATHEQKMEHNYLGKTFLVSCSPVVDGKEILGFVHTARDITQEKNLKKQLIQAQKMEAIATLAGGIAHDFNNILGAILGNADLLLYRIPPPRQDKNSAPAGDPGITLQDVRVNLQAIKKAGNRAKELVSQILTFSRQTQTQRRNVLVTPVIKEAIKLLRASLPANIEINFRVDKDIDHIYADLTRVHQVFMNLCTNAAQAMKEKGGRLDVSLRSIEAGPEELKRYPELQPGRYVALAVQDTGHGMSKEVMNRIFDPFFTTRDVGEGTGMGLAVIHGIVSAHEGVIDVQSEKGKGSVFTVFFPAVKEADVEVKDVVLGLPRGNEKILFVDDKEDIVKMSTRMLEYLGYQVYVARSGDQALAMIKAEAADIDLVITDYSMPGITGLQLAEKIIKIRKELPVILCSGFSEAAIVDEASKTINCRFLPKPLDMNVLARTIREILSGRDQGCES